MHVTTGILVEAAAGGFFAKLIVGVGTIITK